MIEITRIHGIDREAIVYRNEKVYVVEMLVKGRIFKKTVLSSIDMAENLAEDFVGDSIGSGPSLLNE